MPLGIIAAHRRNSGADVGTMVFANIGVSMPVFWLGLMLQFVFAVKLRDTFLALPPSGRLSPGVVSTPFYEQWGLAQPAIFEFLSPTSSCSTSCSSGAGTSSGTPPAT